ncbi:DUF5615 family PIN-like protein [Chitinophaga sp.]|uniref:DUF5615 family PIN-like protein n=1 Tax=Chitinophaga sp. TaxID=1869181 RepID=UPI0039C8B09E
MPVSESAKSIKDDQVIQLALQYGYLLLTEDKDFGEWVFAHHVKDLSVLFLRYSFQEFNEIAHTVVHLLKTQTLKRPFFAT